MAQNIEIKARARHFAHQLALASQLADGPATRLLQTDTFFTSPQGRLKLRELRELREPSESPEPVQNSSQNPEQNAQLIYYCRENQAGPKLSEYYISHTADVVALKHTLSQTLGILATVEKTRTLLISGCTRLHFDQVLRLGEFIELEVELSGSQTLLNGEQDAKHLMRALEIQVDDLIDCAYVDLLLNQGGL